MEEFEGSARGVSLRAAACMLVGDVRDPIAGGRVRSAVDAQLRRAGVEAQDAGDVRTEVVLALLCAPAAEFPLPLELVCARVSVIARNKAIDHGRRRLRAPLALGDALPEPPQPGVRAGSLGDGLDEVAAAAHRARVGADLATALERLDAPQRAAIGAHADGGGALASGLPRSTYYRVLAHAQARLRSDLRGRLAGLGALGGAARWARELFAHAEAAHTAAAAVTTAIAVTAAVALSLPDRGARHVEPPAAPVQMVMGGRVSPVAAPPPVRAAAVALPAARALRRRVTVPVQTTPAAAKRSTTAAAALSTASCTYDPSTYDC